MNQASRNPVEVPVFPALGRPSSWALSGVFQIAGSSSSRLTSVSRSLLMSYSKEPPQRFVALGEVFERTADGVGFHVQRTWELASGGW